MTAVARSLANAFVLLVAAALALAPRCTAPEEDVPIAASEAECGFGQDDLHVRFGPDAASLPVRTPGM